MRVWPKLVSWMHSFDQMKTKWGNAEENRLTTNLERALMWRPSMRPASVKSQAHRLSPDARHTYIYLLFNRILTFFMSMVLELIMWSLELTLIVKDTFAKVFIHNWAFSDRTGLRTRVPVSRKFKRVNRTGTSGKTQIWAAVWQLWHVHTVRALGQSLAAAGKSTYIQTNELVKYLRFTVLNLQIGIYLHSKLQTYLHLIVLKLHNNWSCNFIRNLPAIAASAIFCDKPANSALLNLS